MNNGEKHLAESIHGVSFSFVGEESKKRLTVKQHCPLCGHTARKHKRQKVYGKPYVCQAAGCRCTTTGVMLK